MIDKRENTPETDGALLYVSPVSCAAPLTSRGRGVRGAYNLCVSQASGGRGGLQSKTLPCSCFLCESSGLMAACRRRGSFFFPCCICAFKIWPYLQADSYFTYFSGVVHHSMLFPDGSKLYNKAAEKITRRLLWQRKNRKLC